MPHQIILNMQALPQLQTASFLQVAKPFIHADRVLNVHDMVYLVKGQMQIIEDGTEYLLSPGSLIFLKAGVHHWGTKSCAPNTAWYFVHFYLSQEENLPMLPMDDYGQKLNSLSSLQLTPKDYLYGLPLPKLLHEGNGILLEKKLQELTELFHSNAPLRLAQGNVKLYEFLLYCAEQILTPPHVTPAHVRIRFITEYLEKHQREPLNTAELSDYMHLSYKHLATFFKKHTGRTLLEYHTALRMQEAARLLCETNLTIWQISESLGFSDAFYFSNVFKKVYHISPREYRKHIPHTL